uniref:Uncharacterized protein n=1 Tax=Tetranychus urticae TaxID=32264 RepID=T1L083_TETUR
MDQEFLSILFSRDVRHLTTGFRKDLVSTFASLADLIGLYNEKTFLPMLVHWGDFLPHLDCLIYR